MWYNSTAKKLKRWNGSAWDDIDDQKAIDAYENASTAQDTADGKRRVFVTTPTTPYNVGDLWTAGPAGDLKKCKVERLTGSYTASDWELASKYTDDTTASAAASAASAAQSTANTAATNASAALTSLDNIASDSKLTPVEKIATKKERDIIDGEKTKIDAEADAFAVSKTAYGTAYTTLINYVDPLIANLTTTSDITGATFRSTFKAYYDARQDILNAISTKAKTLADNAQTAANNAQTSLTNFISNTYTPAIGGKATIWYQTGIPTATAAGDLWLDTDASPRKIYRAAIVGANEIKAGEWEEITDELLAKALSAAGTAQATADGKIVTFAQDSPPSATAIGDLWVDTNDYKKLYRANAVGTGGWVLYKIAAGYVATSKVIVDDDMVDILSGGKMRLTAPDSIYIGTLPMQQGGTNLLKNSGNFTAVAPWTFDAGRTIGIAYESQLLRNVLTATDIPNQYALLHNVSYVKFITGRAYTLSFVCSATGMIPYCVISDMNGTNIVANFGAFASKRAIGGGYNYYEATAVATGAQNDPVLVIVTPTGDTTVWYATFKLEEGNIATDWSPAPSDPSNGSVTSSVTLDDSGIAMTGGQISIDADGKLLLSGSEVDIDTQVFSVRDGTDERMVLDEDGNLAINAGSVSAGHFIGDVLNSYSGTAITVSGSIQNAINNISKYLINDVTITVPAGTYNENVTINGFIGSSLTIHFQDDVVVNGYWTVSNCSKVTMTREDSFVTSYPQIISTSAVVGLYVDSVGLFNGSWLIVSGKPRTTSVDGTSAGMTISGSRFNVNNCDIQRVSDGIVCIDGSSGVLEANTGGVTGSNDATTIAILNRGIWAVNGAHVGITGAIPTGYTANTLETIATIKGSGTATQSPNAPPDAPPTYATYNSTAYTRMKRIQRREGAQPVGGSITWGSYENLSYEDWATATTRQGTVSLAVFMYYGTESTDYLRQDRYLYYSAWILPAISDLSSITSAILTITRDVSEGSTGAVEIEVYKHAYTSAPSGHDYTGLTDTGLRATLARGQSASITLDATTLAAIKAGTVKGFGLYAIGSYAQMTTSISLLVNY
jgi:hypothetical protein